MGRFFGRFYKIAGAGIILRGGFDLNPRLNPTKSLRPRSQPAGPSYVLLPGQAVATRDRRIERFNHGSPPEGQPLLLLCEDNNETYMLPFPCEWRGEAWHNKRSEDAKPLSVKVVGWRLWLRT